MKIYTITTNFRSETDFEVKTYVRKTKLEALELARGKRNEFKKSYFDEDDDDYGQRDIEDGKIICIDAFSNNCFLNFEATIEEHNID